MKGFLLFSLIFYLHPQRASSHCANDQNKPSKDDSELIDCQSGLLTAFSVNIPSFNSDSNALKNPNVEQEYSISKSQSSSCYLLCNTDFEDDKLVQAGNFGFFHQDLVSCWSTTATDNQIEIWGSGFGGVPAYSGNQFAELNANMVSTLFQDFKASLGSTVQISFAHRGRAGIDVMSVEIGPVGGPYQNLGDFSANNNAWIFHTLSYTFPSTGGNNYSMRFKSVSAAGGATVGNFLDAISISLAKPTISFTIKPPDCPNDTSGELTVNARGGSALYSYDWLPPLKSTDSTVNGLSSGVYQVEVKDFYGCGEILTINLNSKHKNDTIGITQKVCDSYLWAANGQTYTQSGHYMASLINTFGCDSIVNLDLEISPSYRYNESVKICNLYTWPVNGKTYTQSGIYADTLSNASGCDSIRTLNLDILPTYQLSYQLKNCDTYVWPVNGQTYMQSGIYKDTLTNALGCDSIIILNLEIVSSQNTIQSIQICKSYTWPVNGKTYSQSGNYIDTLTNKSGCDSIIHLDLLILPSQNTNVSVQICGSYTWPVNGKKYSQSGTYADTLTNAMGCDSIINLQLEILPAYRQYNILSNCESYTWPVNNQTYSQSGIYIDTLTNSFGCDSIMTLELQIHPAYRQLDTIKICDVYTWPVNGKTYKQSGMYSSIFQSRYGCDSIFTLQLTILASSILKQTVNACDSFTWKADGTNYTKTGTYNMHTFNIAGCDSSVILNLTIHPSYLFKDAIRICDTYTWPVNGKTYNQTGNYDLKTQSSFGCDSSYFLSLTVDPSYTIYDTVTALDRYVWPVSKGLYDKTGIYQEPFRSVDGCDSLRILVLIIKHIGNVYVPNVFTPNGDGINDKESIFSSPEISVIDRFRIFDRWGELLYELLNFPPNDPQYGWNGNFREEKMNPGVFVYTVEWTDFYGGKHLERGDVTLIR